jgi:molecular chaperone GrpE
MLTRVNSFCNGTNGSDAKCAPSRKELMFEAAAVLAGTILMASGTTGNGPDAGLQAGAGAASAAPGPLGTSAGEAAQEAAAQHAEANVPKVDALLLEERTRDLQRVQAEYANYRKRADRERQAAGEIAVGRVLTELIPVLDNIDRARQHGDLTGGLKAVADQLQSVVDKLGLVAFGEVGDPFDPSVHEAVMHAESDEVSETTCTTVMRQGYKLGERLLRPAMVGVTDPASPAPSDPEPQPDPEPEAQEPAPEQQEPPVE